jgi:hypothetical protein
METENSKETVNREITELQCSSFHGPISNVKSYGTEAFYELYERTKSNKYKKQIEAMRAEPDPKKQSAMKSKLDYFTPSVICTERKSSCITDFSGVICADLDGKDNPGKTPQQMRVTVLNDPLLHSFMAIVSSLGKGLKVMFRYDPKVATVEDYSHAIMQYLADVCHLKADRACCDPTRACFVSYDPQAYYSTAGQMCGVDVNIWLARYKQFQGVPEKIPANASFKYSPSNVSSSNVPSSSEILPSDPSSIHSSKADSLENEVDFQADSPENHCMDEQTSLAHVQAVAGRIDRDIAPNYEDFLRLGFSLATLGETGRPIFEHCCSYYKGEQTRDLNKFFTDCLHKKRDDIKIATFFELCRTAGVDISNPSADLQIEERMDELPLFPDWFFDKLPPLLQKIVSHGDNVAEKSMLMMTAMSVLSSVMPNYYMVYNGDRMEANLFFFVLAKSGSGKGKMKHCLQLVRPIHDKMLEQSLVAIREYKLKEAQMKARNRKKRRNEPDEIMMDPKPPFRVFIMPAESSGAAFMRMFYENGGRGLMFETEGDTLAYIFGKDYGSFSDKFRKIPHHEPMQLNRVGNSSVTINEKEEGTYFEIKYPCMSAILSGTPNQLRNLISTSENGLFNRFSFLYLPDNVDWVDQYGVNDGKLYKDLFDSYAQDVYVMHMAFECRGEEGVHFRMTPSQREKVDKYFRTLLLRSDLLYEGDYNGTVRRLGVIHGRLCMILTALRVQSVAEYEQDLICSDEDVDMMLEMVKILNCHTSYAYRSLTPKPKENTMMNMPTKYRLYQALPKEFTATDAMETANALKIGRSCVYKYINLFVKGKEGKGCLLEKTKHGIYRKTVE